MSRYSRPSLIRTGLIRTGLIRTLTNPNEHHVINMHISSLLVRIIIYTVYLSRVILSNGVGCTSCEKSPQDAQYWSEARVARPDRKEVVYCALRRVRNWPFYNLRHQENESSLWRYILSVIRTNSLIWTLFNSCWYKAIQISEGLLYCNKNTQSRA